MTLTRRLTAAIGVGALALLGAAAFAGPANADTTGGNAPAGPYTLTITKLQNPPGGGTPTDGTVQTNGLTPIPGVVFSVAPVTGVDLTTPAGWTTAAGLAVNSAGQVVGGGSTYTTGAATALPATGGSGVTSYTTSTPAVYEVTETSAPAGTELGAPFLVSLPLPQGGNWLTNVFVYPKNTVQGAPVKSVDDTGVYGVGAASLNWSVASTVPNQVAGDAFTQYSLTDPLDARLTPPAPAMVTVSLASSTGAAITLPAADYTVGVSGQTVTVDFTASGLALLTANPGAVVTATIPTVVGAVGSGTIRNIADQTISTQTGTSVTTPSNPVQDTWGDVSLHKVDPNGKALAGAQFQVFTSASDAQTLTNPVAVNGATTFTSDASGAVAIDGLKAQNDGVGADLTYYLVETQAPAGYTIAPAFAQAAGGYAQTVAPGAANPTVTVTDPQAPPIALPLTGSTGTTVFVVGGLALAALAVAVAVLVIRRRAREERPAA
ncbi:SpaH/EbpB family LPXTG-anchored major pilin [Leifsonia sp. NPDC056665]|uniref:SpaH/EbpB family LPXTG-anchored major pilin n=1 Tax=Leifsonia sp. NPDC056665 TaxID=3345901 RepID=UPI0036A7B58A